MKLIKFLFGFIFTIILLVILSFGALFLLVQDNGFEQPDYLNDSNGTTLNIGEVLSYGLVDTPNNEKVAFVLTEEEINLILKKYTAELNVALKELAEIKTLYVLKENDNQLKLISYVHTELLNTSVKAFLSYEIKNNQLVFHLTELDLGKIKLPISLFTSFLNSNDINEKVNSSLETLRMNFNLSNNELTFSIDLVILKDLLTQSLSDTPDYDLYMTLLSLIMRVNNSLTTNNSDNVGFDLNVSDFSFDSSRDSTIPYSLDFDSVKGKVEVLLNKVAITSDEATMTATYLIKGFDNISETEQNIIKHKDFSSIGIDDISTYKGMLNYDNTSVSDIFKSQVSLPFNGLKLSEDDFNNILLQNNIVGQMYSFVRKEEDSYRVSYIALESVYVDIEDDNLAINLTISLNGKSIVLVIDVNTPETRGLMIDGYVNSIRLGNIILNNEEVKGLLSYLDNTVDEEWIMFDSTNSSIDIDFSSIFSKETILSQLLEMVTVSTKLVSNSDGDYILIS